METATPRWKDDKEAYHKKYYNENKERLLAYRRNYHKTVLSQKRHQCEVCNVCVINFKQHCDTKKHTNNLKFTN